MKKLFTRVVSILALSSLAGAVLEYRSGGVGGPITGLGFGLMVFSLLFPISDPFKWSVYLLGTVGWLAGAVLRGLTALQVTGLACAFLVLFVVQSIGDQADTPY